MNSNLLKGALKAQGLTQRTTAQLIGMSASRFSAKINGTNGAEFSLGEAKKLRDLLRLDTATCDAIFFNAAVS